MQELTVRRVVTCFLNHEGLVLLLRRSRLVGSYRGRWAGVSGAIETVTALEQARQEVREETGLGGADVSLLRQGEPLVVPDPDKGVEWRVYTFLFQVREPSLVRLDWEHSESRWVHPSEMATLDTVPKLREAWEQVSEK